MPDGAKGTEPRTWTIRRPKQGRLKPYIEGPELLINERVRVVEQQPPTEGKERAVVTSSNLTWTVEQIASWLRWGPKVDEGLVRAFERRFGASPEAPEQFDHDRARAAGYVPVEAVVEWLRANSEESLNGQGYIERADEVADEIAREFGA